MTLAAHVGFVEPSPSVLTRPWIPSRGCHVWVLEAEAEPKTWLLRNQTRETATVGQHLAGNKLLPV